jgi:hypothetical protein
MSLLTSEQGLQAALAAKTAEVDALKADLAAARDQFAVQLEAAVADAHATHEVGHPRAAGGGGGGGEARRERGAHLRWACAGCLLCVCMNTPVCVRDAHLGLSVLCGTRPTPPPRSAVRRSWAGC